MCNVSLVFFSIIYHCVIKFVYIFLNTLRDREMITTMTMIIIIVVIIIRDEDIFLLF